MEFTKEMRSTHVLYLPSMLDHHFPLVRHAMRGEGYRVIVLRNKPKEEHIPQGCVCYPMSQMVGQMVTALEDGICENPRRSAFLLPPAGAGCAGENHFRPIENALERAGYGNVPVLALDIHEKQFFSGLSLTPSLARKSISAILIGDLLQLCLMETAPVEEEKGSAEALYKKWVYDLGADIATGKTCSGAHRRKYYEAILESFAALPKVDRPVKKVVIGGEPYLKYCTIGNRDLLRTLWDNNYKVWLSGFVGYGTCVVDALRERFELAGKRTFKNFFVIARDYACKLQKEMFDFMTEHGIDHPSYYDVVKEGAAEALEGIRMDDAWYLGADMIDAMSKGYHQVLIPCADGCLGPKRLERDIVSRVKAVHPEAQVTMLDFTPGQTAHEQALADFLAEE